MLVDDVSRWSVLAFASVHAVGLLTHHPVPWSATRAAASLVGVAFAATARAATGTLRSLALLSGLAAVAMLVAEVEYRGGWPFLLAEAPVDGNQARVEAALLTVAVVGLSAAALLPEHGTEERLRALGARFRAWREDRRTRVLDLMAPPAEPGAATTAPVVLDLGVLEPHRPAPAPEEAITRPRRGAGWWRARLAAAGVIAVTALVVLVAMRPMWHRDAFGQVPLVMSPDRAGMLLTTVPVLLAVLAAAVAACVNLRRSGRRGVAVAAAAFVVLAVPVAWARGGGHRFSPEPPRSAQASHAATLSEYVGAPEIRVEFEPGYPMTITWDWSDWLYAQGGPNEQDAQSDLASRRPRDAPPGWTDGSWWSEPVDWADVSDGVLGGLPGVAFLALVTALLPAPRRTDLLSSWRSLRPAHRPEPPPQPEMPT